MKGRSKLSAAALILSVCALLIAAVNLVYSAARGLPMWSAITIFCAMIAIFCSNLAIGSKKTNK